MIRIKKTMPFTLGSLVTVFCTFLLYLDIQFLLEGEYTEHQFIGTLFFMGTMPFIGFGVFLLAYSNRPRRRKAAPAEHVNKLRSLLISNGGHASMTRIIGSLELTHDEIHSAMHLLKKNKQGKFKENQYGEKEFVLMPECLTSKKTVGQSIREFIIRSSKIRMVASFLFILGCVMILVAEQCDPCCGPIGYYIIIVVSSMVIISGSYIIGFFKKGSHR